MLLKTGSQARITEHLQRLHLRKNVWFTKVPLKKKTSPAKYLIIKAFFKYQE
jgi:hypothetical protein